MDKDRIMYGIVAIICIVVGLVLASALTGCGARQWGPGDSDRARICASIMASYQRGIENAIYARDVQRITREMADFKETFEAQGCNELAEKVLPNGS